MADARPFLVSIVLPHTHTMTFAPAARRVTQSRQTHVLNNILMLSKRNTRWKPSDGVGGATIHFVSISLLSAVILCRGKCLFFRPKDRSLKSFGVLEGFRSKPYLCRPVLHAQTLPARLREVSSRLRGVVPINRPASRSDKAFFKQFAF